jgi:hypothetical protein
MRSEFEICSDWLYENKAKIEAKKEEASVAQEQLNENKDKLIKKWKLKNIVFKSNWSLKSFNSYLQALNNFTLNKDTHFEGFTLVLTNNDSAGLRKNGDIHLNCSQVYQEWLNVRTKSDFYLVSKLFKQTWLPGTSVITNFERVKIIVLV